MKIEKLNATHFPEAVAVWEASVRATHHFLKEEDIVFYQPFVKQGLEQVEAYGLWNDAGKLLGFMGIQGQHLEMLFLHPDARGKGFGRMLLEEAFRAHNLRTVDVNEQNEGACGFYRRFGFRTESRDEADGFGKPYPILHLRLDE